jgi:hypothetical protein
MSKSVFANSREFIKGIARFNDLVYIISKGKTLISQDVEHTSLIAIDGIDWADAIDTDWNSSAITIARKPKEKAILVGENGEIITYVAGESENEKTLPNVILIRNAKTISGYVYACGMKRQVFKRVDENKWIDLSVTESFDAKDAIGFEDINGFSETEIYACGWLGEIYQYNGEKWTKQKSLTTLILTSICCAKDGFVYVAGQNGILIKGRNNDWEIIRLEIEFSTDIWDLCWFEDTLYVATMSNLLTLENNKLIPVDFGETKASSFYSLSSADGVLWSVGKEDVLSFDGKNWNLYE